MGEELTATDAMKLPKTPWPGDPRDSVALPAGGADLLPSNNEQGSTKPPQSSEDAFSHHPGQTGLFQPCHQW